MRRPSTPSELSPVRMEAFSCARVKALGAEIYPTRSLCLGSGWNAILHNQFCLQSLSCRMPGAWTAVAAATCGAGGVGGTCAPDPTRGATACCSHTLGTRWTPHPPARWTSLSAPPSISPASSPSLPQLAQRQLAAPNRAQGLVS